MANPANYGNWWVENGVLVQQKPGDGYTALVEDVELSDQLVETELKLVGYGCYGGIILWFQDTTHRVNIRVYPAANRVIVGEVNSSVLNSQYYTMSLNTSTWYKLRVEADSTSGELDVYLDDVYLFTYTATTPNRMGQTGIFNGNSSEGAYFDNFRLVSNGILPLAVSVDIKPNSCPNSLNDDANGKLTVAILGTADFDITSIDVASVRLEGVAPDRSSVNDVAKPVSDYQSYECNSDGEDGYDDLILKFQASDVVDALGEVLEGDEIELTLTGELNDGTSIEGRDCIVFVSRGNRH